MHPRRYRSSLLLLALAVSGGSLRAAEPTPTFDDVAPIFQAKCSKCHGGSSPKADLDLSTVSSALKGGESGAVIVAGDANKSALFHKVRDGTMPPGKKDRLGEADVRVIERWIAGGARAGTVANANAPSVTQHDVLPILMHRCTVCHGRHKQEGGLDLRTRAAMVRGGKSGPAIVPGKPEDSLLIKKLRAGQMPPNDRLVEFSVKPVESSEVDLLARWIATGAPEVPVEPDVATTTPDPLVADKDRDYWAFRPPPPVAIPNVQSTSSVRNPIDAFVLQRLEKKGLTLSPEASRAALFRRAYLDLTGLPAEPAEVQAFLADSSPDAYERMIDRLLASPRYGERWGRHWLDLAGYADSEGKREQDLPRPHAWRYRDYVIRAFNADKPYNRFLLEQIAGDELADYESAKEITPELYDNLVATGFLRMAPDPTWANITGFVPDRLEVIADEMDVLGSAVMGLTLKCARCHSHKFDPIPQRDYYRLLAVFKGAFDEYDWLKPDVRPGLGPISQDTLGGRLLPHVTSDEARALRAHNAPIQAELDTLRSTLDRRTEALTSKVFEERLSRLPEVLRDDLRATYATAPEKRNDVQKYLAAKFDSQLKIDRNALKGLDAELKKYADETEAKLRELQARLRPEPRIHALWDRGDPSPTYVYRRGNHLTPGRVVGPGVPSVLTDGKTPFEVRPPWPGANKTGRRLAFARWLTGTDHPLTARVAVNRIWKHHFGTGIVPTLGNFGKAGSPPTHPELLDWLTREFVRNGWSIKAMHRLMMTSSTYRQSSAVSVERARLDPANALYSRMPFTRLDAESLHDTLLLVSGRLDLTPFGPPDGVQVRADGLVTPKGTDRGWRRLVYVQQARKQITTLQETFDAPQMNPNCVERRQSTVAPQALHLMNNGMVEELAGHFARRVRLEAGPDPGDQVELAFLIAYGRPATSDERKLAQDSLRRLTDRWTEHLAAAGKPDADAARRALGTFCHALMNSAAFLYVD